MARDAPRDDPQPETKAIVEAILAAHPELSAYGLGHYYGGGGIPLAKREADHQKSREQLLMPDGLVQFEICCEWVRHVGVRKTINRRHSSYGWKHYVEAWSGQYIYNGAMIAAAYHMGVKTHRAYDRPNLLLALREPKRNADGILV